MAVDVAECQAASSPEVFKPEVSIIMPVYNAEEFLHEALESIFNQSFLRSGGCIEVSVFDDGSSDGSASILESWKARFHEAFPDTVMFTIGLNTPRLEAAKRGERRAEAYMRDDTCDSEADKADVSGCADQQAPCNLCGQQRPRSELAGKKAKTKVGDPLFCPSCRALSKEEWQVKRREAYERRKPAPKEAMLIKAAQPQGVPCGIGFACNSAVQQAAADFLCRFDADDVMHEDRIQAQLDVAWSLPEGDRDRVIVGSGFVRHPEDATPRYTSWLNGMSDEQLHSQRFREVTLLHPTWLYHRSVWQRVGGYTQDTAVGEDIVFFHRHLEAGGLLRRVPRPLLTYRCHPGQRSWRLPRRAVQDAKVAAFERQVLAHCPEDGSSPWCRGFTVVGAGRDARYFLRALSAEGRTKVTALHDVDPKKIGSTVTLPAQDGKLSRQVPILAQECLEMPCVICVALGRGYGVRRKLADGHPDAVEGVDYFHMV